MSKFAARMVAGLSSIYDRLGDSAVYTDETPKMTDCTVIVEHDFADYGDTPTISADTVLIRVRCSELASRPLRGGVFTMDDGGDVYTVVRVLPASDEYEHRVLAK